MLLQGFLQATEADRSEDKGLEFDVCMGPLLAPQRCQVNEVMHGIPQGGKAIDDETVAGDIAIKAGAKFMMMGTPDEEIEQVQAASSAAPPVSCRI